MTGPEPGPLAEEAARLVGAAQEWWHRVVLDPATSRIATGAAECCWCPLCQLIVAMRGERPEFTERLADTQTALAGALRALADAIGLGSPAAGTDAGTDAERPAEPGGVHRIALDDDGAEPVRPS